MAGGIIKDEDQLAINPSHVEWYAISGIVFGTLAFVVGMSALAYKCYQRYGENRNSSDSHQNSLSSAIKKGLKESNNTSMKKSPSLKSTSGSVKGTQRGSFSTSPGFQGNQNDSNSQDRRLSKTSPGSTPMEHSFKTECYMENENEGLLKDGNGNNQGIIMEKEITMREKSEDDLKMNKLGSLYFTVDYDKQKAALVVNIIRASELPAKDPNVGSSDPYIKLQLLPDKRHKVKTRVLRKTLNPVYDEIFTFYGINYNQLEGITLHFVVLSFDRYSRDDIIGEVVYPLAGIEFGEQEVSITKEIMPRHIKIHSHGRGELLISLCYQPAANRLTVVVLKARNLPKMDITGLSDPYVKIYLLYNGQRISKKKTHVKKRTLNPVFNESFLFDVPCNEGLANISLEFLVLDWDRVTKNEVVGRLELGAKLAGTETHHWNEVMNCPRKQIAEWHKLKE